jgi:hypothetical protein
MLNGLKTRRKQKVRQKKRNEGVRRDRERCPAVFFPEGWEEGRTGEKMEKENRNAKKDLFL